MLLVDTTMGIASNLVEVRPPANEDLPDSPPNPDALLASYYELRDAVIRERDAGNLSEALGLADRALSLATLIGDEALIDQAYCNRCGFAAVMGLDVSLPRLREILMRNRTLRASFTAAHVLSSTLSAKKDYKKALFYAQIANQRAAALADVQCIARSRNEIGTCYLRDSYFEKAILEYEAALVALPDDGISVVHTAILGGLGYAKLVTGDFRTGFQLLYRSLRACRKHEDVSAGQEFIHLTLCYGFIELRRWRYAWHHGRRGLELAEKTGHSDAIKASLYLLGELEKSVGDLEAAYHYYSRLENEFFADNNQLAKLMLCCETREIVNLRA